MEVRNFLGEKRVRRVELLPGVEYVRTSDVKDQIELKGNDLTAVSLTAARIQQSTTVKAKDIRKFLDGEQKQGNSGRGSSPAHPTPPAPKQASTSRTRAISCRNPKRLVQLEEAAMLEGPVMFLVTMEDWGVEGRGWKGD